MFVAKLPGSTYATAATNAGPSRARPRVRPGRRATLGTGSWRWTERVLAMTEYELRRRLSAWRAGLYAERHGRPDRRPLRAARRPGRSGARRSVRARQARSDGRRRQG